MTRLIYGDTNKYPSIHTYVHAEGFSIDSGITQVSVDWNDGTVISYNKQYNGKLETGWILGAIREFIRKGEWREIT